MKNADRATFNGPTWLAERMIFIAGDESVEPVPISSVELRPTRDDLFVHPEDHSWPGTDKLLDESRVLVMVGPPGTGRRTAALRRLREQVGDRWLIRLEANWEQPKARHLPPAQQGHGYLLDLSEYDKSPSDDFGTALLSWARGADARLAILTCAAKVTEPWIRPFHQQIVRISTPYGRALAESILRSDGADHLVRRLEDEAFSQIWESSPRASDVLRLVRILRDADSDTTSEAIAEEFHGWQHWFTDKGKCPEDFGLRTLVWSAAMCEGGRRKSVLTMSEILRGRLGQTRTPVDIFSDPFASNRLKEAHIEECDDGVRLDPQSPGLSTAVRLHLWEQFENHRETLIAWSIESALKLDADDARRVIIALMELAGRLGDHTLVQWLFDGLSRKRPELLVEELSRAALDQTLGTFVRGRLYTWLAANPSQEKVDIIAAVCGGQFGLANPGLALTRLGRAALKSPNPVSPALVAAFMSLGTSEYRRLILDTIHRLLNEAELEHAGVAAFLCLAGTEQGITVLCGEGGRELADDDVIERIADGFRRALAHEATRDLAVKAVLRWQDALSRGLLDKDRSAQLFAAVIGREVDRSLLSYLVDNDPVGVKGFVGDVLAYLFQHPQQRRGEEDATDGSGRWTEIARPEPAVTTAFYMPDENDVPDTSGDAVVSLVRERSAHADET